MSEDEVVEEVVEEATEEVAEPSNEPELSEIEIQAINRGHQSREEWKGDPNDYMPAGAYLQWLGAHDAKNQAIKDAKRLKEDYADSLTQMQTMNRAKLAMADDTIRGLQDQKREAIEEADHVKVDAIDRKIQAENNLINQINTVEQQQAQQVQPSNPVYDVWVESNPWINDPADPRVAQANQIYNQTVQANPKGRNDETALLMDALNAVDAAVGKPEITPRRVNHSKAGGNTAKDKTYSELPQSMKDIWERQGSGFKDQAAFVVMANKDLREEW